MCNTVSQNEPMTRLIKRGDAARAVSPGVTALLAHECKMISAIDEAQPDYLLILPWDLKNEIVAQLRYVGTWDCKMVVPILVEVRDPREGVA
jgi:C-methyltransferase C-terminal domain